MEWTQEQGTISAELALETVREWTLALTQVERWLMPHVPRREARRRTWANIRGLLSPVERVGNGQKSTAMRLPMVYNICWGVPGGMTRRSGMMYAPLWWSTWASRRQSWSL